jgi:hypothetical protein
MELATLVLRGGESEVNIAFKPPRTHKVKFFILILNHRQLLAEGVIAFRIEEFYNW